MSYTSTANTINTIHWDTNIPLTNISTTNATTAATWTSLPQIILQADGTLYYQPITYGTYDTNLGTNIHFGFVDDKKVIHPQLYFKFVKSKLNKLEESKLNKRLLTLQKFVVSAENLGQKALYEEFSRKIAITVREQELWACGIELFIGRDAVEKYIKKVRGVDVTISHLEGYARPIPEHVSKRIKRFQDLALFDNYWILYLDYKDKIDVDGKKKTEVVKTTKEKIREKDPIVFGTQTYLPNKFYFIADWVDEHCDLTLDKLVEFVKADDPTYKHSSIEDINEELIQRLVQESRDRFNRLKETNPNNYKKLMEDEDMSYLTKSDTKKSIKDSAMDLATSLKIKREKRKNKNEK